MAGWTRFVLRHRRGVLAFWVAVFLLGGFASSKLSAAPLEHVRRSGTDSEHVRQALEQHFGDRPDGSFTVVFELPPASPDPLLDARLQRVVDRAARPCRRASRPR